LTEAWFNPSRTLGKTQKVIGLLPVVLGLEILVPVAADGNDHPDGVPLNAYIEPPLPVFDTLNGSFLRELPAAPIGVYASDVGDSLMRVWTI
jgi:hypothetical protein